MFSSGSFLTAQLKHVIYTAIGFEYSKLIKLIQNRFPLSRVFTILTTSFNPQIFVGSTAEGNWGCWKKTGFECSQTSEHKYNIAVLPSKFSLLQLQLKIQRERRQILNALS